MSEAGIPMEDVDDATQTGVWAVDIKLGAWGRPDDTSFKIISDYDRPIDEVGPVIELTNAAKEARPGSWILVADGQDYSEAFDACIKSSDYTEPNFVRDPAGE